MIRIGYVRPAGEGPIASAAQIRTLTAIGCDVVRCEEPPGDGYAVLFSILNFVDAGDQLIVARLEHLGSSAHAMLEALERLEQRGASLQVVDPEISSLGPSGPALRAALEAAASVEPAARTRQPAAASDIHAMRRAGYGPVEIARRLGVSRMTVWRKLKAAEACQA